MIHITSHHIMLGGTHASALSALGKVSENLAEHKEKAWSFTMCVCPGQKLLIVVDIIIIIIIISSSTETPDL